MTRTALDAGFQIIVPVWGEAYTRCFAEVSLPTLMAPGNIPSLPNPERHVLAIYTTPVDRRLIEASPVFGPLSAAIKVEFHPVRARVGAIFNSYDVQSDCFRRAIRRADAADQAMVFLTPDLIMADGSLAGLARIAATPARAVLGVGIRLEKPLMRERLEEHRSARGDTIAVGPRALTKLALEALHPIAHQHMLRSDTEEILPSNLYWRVGDEGLVAHCFHLHPFLIYPRIKNAPFSNTVDGNYIEAACPDLADAYIITDSDEFSAWELSDPSQRVPGVKRADPMETIDWVGKWTTPRHRALIRTPIRIHTGIVAQDLWTQAETEATSVVTSLLSMAEASDAFASTGGAGAAAPAAPAPPTPIRFVTRLCDAGEARRFADVALPSLLAFANIPSQLHKHQYTYRIVAGRSARAVVEAAASMADLREHVAVDLEFRDDRILRQEETSAALRYEAIAAGAEGCATLFVDPDCVLADNSLAVVRQMLDDKMRAILVPRLRLRRDSATAALHAGFGIDGILSILPGELVGLALDHLHPSALAQFRDGNGADPSTLCWRVGDEGMLLHTFNYHPLLVHARLGGHGLTVADDPLLGGLGIEAGEVALIRDSRALVTCRLAGDDEVALPPPCPEIAGVVAWAAANTRPFHRLLFRNQARLFSHRDKTPMWKPISDAAMNTAQGILAALASPPAARSA